MESKKYKIGWYDTHTGKWKYILVFSKEDALAELADKLCLSDRISCKVTNYFKLIEEKDV